jgi:hypothetical protein
MPALGYGQSSADLERRTARLPSACMRGEAQPCFADANTIFAAFDLHLRIAVGSGFSLSLSGGYMLGLDVKSGMDQISSTEATAKMSGFHLETGASVLVTDWFAVQAIVPVRRYVYALTPVGGGSATYRGAADLYYGMMVGLAVLAP